VITSNILDFVQKNHEPPLETIGRQRHHSSKVEYVCIVLVAPAGA
jgi:hypothetical protein